MTDITAEDCQSCGACCIAEREDPDYVSLDDEDYERLSGYYQRTKVTVEDYPGFTHLALHTKTDGEGNCVCTALSGTVGRKVRCMIYERRPRACSTFKPGSRMCLEARLDARIEERIEV